jgi:mono/diheme cytochrome c family protein
VFRLALGVLALATLVVAGVVTTRGRSVKVVGDRARGEVLFKGYCSGCHTLRAAGATGRHGPNLDRLKPSYARVITQLETGGTQGAGLPRSLLTFGPGIHTFTKRDERDIAAFVFWSTHT